MGPEDDEKHLVTRPKVGDLGRYRLIAELARGGMGIVYLALVRGPGGFNKLFVVKELKPHLAEDANLVRMFVEEARLAARLNHPNVVQTIEIGSDGGRHFIAMEFLDGQSLNRLLHRSRRTGATLPLHHQLHVVAQLLEGLHYAHEVTDFDGALLGLVHRDVSPHNVFVTYDGQVKLLDFGIAKSIDSSNDTRTGVLKGKVSYMSPEQSAGAAIDRRADLFSVGVMLWEAAVGERMWSKSQNDMQILHALMQGAVPSPREAKPDLDPTLERIILKATAVKTEDRYATAVELQSELEIYLESLAQPSFGGRDLGRFVADAFVRERAQVKAVIDAQLRVLQGIASSEYGTIDLPLLSTATSSAPSGTPSAVLLASGSGGGADLLVPSSSVSTPGFRAAFDLPLEPSGGGSLFGSRRRRSTPRRRRAGAAVSALLVVGAAALALRYLPSRRPGGPTPASAPLPELSTARVPSPLLEPARVTVTASPRGARISIDDGARETDALSRSLPRDGAAHAIRVEAPRYEPKVLHFSADGDRTFQIALAPVSEPAPTPPPAARSHARADTRAGAVADPAEPPVATTARLPVAPAAAPAPALPAATPHSKQQIDPHDPYAN